MDPIDYQILDLLQRDARTTQVQIAEAVGLSQPSVAERVRKLEEGGVVLGYVARLDARQIPDFLECHRVAGLDSYLLKVVSRNPATLDELLSGTLRRIPGVTRTTTTIVLATVKETTVVPLQQGAAAPRRRKEAL